MSSWPAPAIAASSAGAPTSRPSRYDESLLFAEDVDLLLRLRRLGRTRGQRLARMRGAKSIASLRKFDEHGEWHYFRHMARVAASRLGRGRGARELADRYWYRPNR